MRLVVPIVAASLALTASAFAQSGGSPDGWTAAVRSGCKVRNPAPQPREEASWFGACVRGFAEGPGRVQWYVDGSRTDLYEGDMRSGLMDGKGTYTWRNGDRYIGDFRANKRHGQGVLIFYNGDRYEGDFRDGRQSGSGTYTWSGGNRYKGEFADGRPEGQGVFAFSAGGAFEGQWKNGLPNGPGTHRRPDGQSFAGTWSNGCFRDGSRRDVVLTTSKRCGF
jgi:hypothetical protein